MRKSERPTYKKKERKRQTKTIAAAAIVSVWLYKSKDGWICVPKRYIKVKIKE